MIRDDATEAQVRAARPDTSTWLSANAGSGKTRVLTDRVARLLLGGERPENILCLTYTKAAAAEMQNRLFDRLGSWAMMPDDRLRAELQQLGEDHTLPADALARARTLFASAIEAPGGLKIQTIHAFCAALLRRFPLEAGVSPQFHEMEDRAAELLTEDIVEAMAADQPAVVEALARHLTDEDFSSIVKAVIGNRALFARQPDLAALRSAFDLPHPLPEDHALSLVFTGGEEDLIARTCALLSQCSAAYQALGARLSACDFSTPNAEACALLRAEFLYSSDDKKNGRYKAGDSKSINWPQSNHAKVVATMQPVLPDLHALMDRTAEAFRAEKAEATVQRSHALHAFGHHFLDRYEAAKARRGWLDFDDLIQRAADLLSDPAVAQWVLYRLDGRIDHVLVDEAQDTSPAQWQVIERLTQDFTSGAGARDVARTIFVVGDKKQSIYSFQGAAPEEFDRMRADFQARYDAIGQPFRPDALTWSFRSAAPILEVVDETFAGYDHAGFSPDERHSAFKTEMPGRVDLWPVFPPAEKAAEPEWTDPVDRVDPADPARVLAEAMAARIGDMLDHATIPEEIGRTGTFRMRKVRPGDILILVQRRGAVFHEVIRACKKAGLPIAGADRLRIGGELAVRDLGALLTALATPEDDLSLAAALRSPLFGLSEGDIYDLAQGRRRGQFLIERLRDAGGKHAEARAIWSDLVDQTDFLRPYDLIERILTRHGGRVRLLSRLGAEAEDGIDALLAQALAYERENVPSLTGFLRWMETDIGEIKRQADSSGSTIRVMTVHGAKGLEAPIVFLPDTGARKAPTVDTVMDGDGLPLWRANADAVTPLQKALAEAQRSAAEAERERLLYVAMTRAECWLIAAAAGKLGDDGTAWHDRIRTGMEARNALPCEFGARIGPGLRLETGDWSAAPQEATAAPPARVAAAPLGPVTAAPAPIDPLSPSDLGGAKALPGEAGQDMDSAKRMGRLVHLALEHLSGHDAGTRAALWPRIAALDEEPPDPDEARRALAAASAVLDHPDCAPLFAPGVLAEVPITADLPGLGPIRGTIDRLIISPERVLAVDFKTNLVVPDTPEAVPGGLLRQMGAYAAALEQLYPDRRVATAILWTTTQSLMVLPHDLVIQALEATTLP